MSAPAPIPFNDLRPGEDDAAVRCGLIGAGETHVLGEPASAVAGIHSEQARGVRSDGHEEGLLGVHHGWA